MIILAIILAVVVLVLCFMFPLARVYGCSMLPTLHEGEVLLCRRVLNKNSFVPKRGQIYVFRAPYDDENEERRLIIKRAFDVVPSIDGKELYVELLGDNLPQSYDSRHYGYVPTKNVVAEVVKVLIK